MKRQLTLLACVSLVLAILFSFASCKLFNKSETPETPEHTHSFVEGKCECGESDPNYVPEHKHSFKDGKCECGESDPNYKPECEHTYSMETTKAPTCTDAGEKTFTCTQCGYFYIMTAPALGHTEVILPEQAPTCTATGLTEGLACSVCEAVLKAQDTVAATGHTFVEGVCACGEVDPEYNGPKTYTLSTADMFVNNADGTQNLTDKLAIPAGSTWGTEGYFTVTGEVTQRIKNNAVYCVELAKQGGGGVQFTVNGTATVTINFHSTSSSNTSWFGLADENGTLLENNEGVNTVYGTGSGLDVTYNLTAGTYTIVSPALTDAEGKDPYNRTVRLYTVSVTETPSSDAPAHVNALKIGETNKIVVSGETLNAYQLPVEWVEFKVTDNGTYTFVGDNGALAWVYDAEGNSLCGMTGIAFLEVGTYYVCVGNGAVGEMNVTVTQTLDPATHNHTFSLGFCKCGAECTHEYVNGVCSICKYADPDYVPSVPVGENDTVLNFSDWGGYAEGTFADGATQVLNKYFTFIHAAKSRIDGNSKDFDDGFAGTQRFNFGGKTETGAVPEKSALKITVDSAATVKVWWVSGGDNRLPVLLDAEGNEIDIAPESVKNGLYITELAIPAAGTYYLGNKDGNNYWFKVELVLESTVDPEPEYDNLPTEGTIEVETTDTYTYDVDIYTFTVTEEGAYTFTVPAGLGLYSKTSYDARGEAEVDFYANVEGATYTFNLKAGDTFTFHVASIDCDVWTIEVSFVAGEVGDEGGDTPGGDTPGGDTNTNLVLGNNTISVPAGSYGQAVECTFTVETEGQYTFASNDLMAIIVIDEMTSYRGSAYLTPGTYVVNVVYYTSDAKDCTLTISFEAPSTNEPDGTDANPFVWETIPESVTFNSDTYNKVYYLFTSNVNGAITFTWTSEDSWFDIYEIVDGNTTANNVSGYQKTSHTFLIEAGKTYRVGLGTWMEAGEVTITISAVTCEQHSWSEATCSAPSTCANCGATTGDALAHTPNVEVPTCTTPQVCTVCGTTIDTADHSWDYENGNITVAPDCSTETNGVVVYPCLNCDETNETIYYYSHDMIVDEEVAATCTTAGHYLAHCGNENCSYTYSENYDATGHWSYAYLSCGESGVCDACGVTYTKEHEAGFFGIEPGCTTDGQCGNCGGVMPALGHNPGAEATCTTAQLCTVCFEEITPALGHNGLDDFVCDTCGETVLPEDGATLTIPQALAIAKMQSHNTYTTNKYYISGTVTGLYNVSYGNFYLKDADGNEICIYGLYTEDNVRYDKMEYKPVNGDVVTVYTVLGMYNTTAQGKNATLTEVVAHEHNYVATVTDPTCLKDGYTTHTCSICGDAYVDTPVEALGHTTELGTCERCGSEITGEVSTEPVVVSASVKDLITQYGWTDATTKQSFDLDNVVSVKINGGSNTGKAYNGDHIRIYATDSPAGTITISVPDGYELVSIKISTQTGTYAFLYVDGTTTDICNQTVSVSGSSVLLNSVKNGTNGKQVRVTAIEVTYKAVG